MTGVSAGAVGPSTTVLRRMETRPGTSAATVLRGARRGSVPAAVVILSLALTLVLSAVLAGPATAQASEPSGAETPAAGEGDGAVAGQAVAQDAGEEDAGEEGAGTADAGADDEAENEVRLIVGLLIGVSVVAVVLTALFWYHTIPSRRVIAARRRRARAAKTRTTRRTSASGPDDLRAS